MIAWSTVGIVSDDIKSGLFPVICSKLFTTPAMWPIEPPAMYPYDMSQRK